MNVSFLGPLQRAAGRSRDMLFRPFQIRIWLVLGFAAFLSEGLFPGKGMRGSFGRHTDGFPGHWFHGFWGFLTGALATGLGVFLVIAGLALAILFLWINSRGRFVFLDDVVRREAAIVAPWRRYAKLSHSLFLASVVFLFVSIALMVLVALPFIAAIVAFWAEGSFNWGMLGALWAMFALASPLLIIGAFVVLFVSDFVIPIMHRNEVGVVEGWRRFTSIFRTNPAAFVVYGLFVFVLRVLVIAALAVVGLASCCTGFVLFALPYVSSVVLLPVHVTFRALGPEFLGQFGPGLTAFGEAPPVPGEGAPS